MFQPTEPIIAQRDQLYRRLAAWWRIAALAVVVAWQPVAAIRADEAADAAAVAPLVSESTLVVAKIDPMKLQFPDLDEVLRAAAPEVRAAVERQAVAARAALQWVQSASGGRTIYATAGVPLSKSLFPFFVQLSTDSNIAPEAVQQQWRLQATQVTEHKGHRVLAPAPGSDVRSLLRRAPPAARQEVEAAFASVSQFPVQVLILPPNYLHRTIEELLPEFPDAWGGGSTAVLTDGVRWAALGLDLRAMRAECVVQSTSQAAAQTFADRAPALVRSALAALEKGKVFPAQSIEPLLTMLHAEVQGNQVHYRIGEPHQLSQTLQAFSAAAEAIQSKIAQQAVSNRFKQLLLAMHNYHDATGSFPPSKQAREKGGKLSWRVHLLPFLDEGALYQEFHLDEPWDSEHNRALLERMPVVYHVAGPGAATQPGFTTFLAPAGPGSVLGDDRPVSFADIVDGSSNTAILVQVQPDRAVPWTAPQDYAFDPQDPGAGLQANPDGSLTLGIADGSVQQISSEKDAEFFRVLFHRNDGKVAWR